MGPVRALTATNADPRRDDERVRPSTCSPRKRGLGRGTASTALLVGSRLARLHREPPDLVQLDEDDNFVATTHSYATLAETWFGVPGRRPPPGSPTPLQ